MKTLAVLGFIVIVAFLTWLAVMVVRFIPGAFASLANLAESLNNRPVATEAIEIETDGAVFNSGDSFAIDWNTQRADGTYALSYACTEGVSLTITVETDTFSVPCGETYMLRGDIDGVDAVFASEKMRFADVPYTVSFFKDGDADPTESTGKTLTIVNPSIPQGQVAGVDTTPATPEVPVTPAPVTKPASTPTTPSYTYTYTTTYSVPKSDPKGYTELAVKYLGVGVLKGGTFVPKGELESGDQGAFQFEVKNTGTKTSTAWTYDATTTAGDEYHSTAQDPLKPNERQIITIGFGDLGNDGIRRFGASIDGGNDTSTKNNSFTWAVTID